MKIPMVHSLRADALVALIGSFGVLAVWAGWGSSSTLSLVWIAFVGAGLVIATALAVRSGGPTRSLAHVQYDVEHQGADGRGDVPQGANSGGLR
jgi:hypothetical protein